MKYISAPFSKCNNQEERIKQITAYAAKCFKNGEHVICPTTLGNAYCNSDEVIKNFDSDHWYLWYKKFFPICTEMDVLMFDGWEDSVGVAHEISLASEHNLKINYIKIENESNESIVDD